MVVVVTYHSLPAHLIVTEMASYPIVKKKYILLNIQPPKEKSLQYDILLRPSALIIGIYELETRGITERDASKWLDIDIFSL